MLSVPILGCLLKYSISVDDIRHLLGQQLRARSLLSCDLTGLTFSDQGPGRPGNNEVGFTLAVCRSLAGKGLAGLTSPSSIPPDGHLCLQVRRQEVHQERARQLKPLRRRARWWQRKQYGDAWRGHPALLLPQAGRSAGAMVLNMGTPRLVKSIFVNKKHHVL